jgi:hypothetical protein
MKAGKGEMGEGEKGRGGEMGEGEKKFTFGIK